MNKCEKYKALAEIFLKRLIDLEIELNDQERKFEENNNYIIKILVESGDIMPISEMVEVLKNEKEIFDDIIELTDGNHSENLEKKVENFLEKYVN